jgi:hypothetical protein
MKISLLVPTRKRPDKMQLVWDSSCSTAKHPSDLQIVFYIDNDDADSIDKVKSMISKDNVSGRIVHIVGKRLKMGSNMWNIACNKADGEIFWLGGDDNIFRQKNWDEIVRKEFLKFPDRIAYVYGWDGLRRDELGTHGFLHRNWVEAVGFFVPDNFVFYKTDQFLTNLASQIGRKVFLKDILIAEHMHYSKGKSKKDTTYLERLAMFKGSKKLATDNYVKTMSPKDKISPVEKLRNFIESFEK